MVNTDTATDDLNECRAGDGKCLPGRRIHALFDTIEECGLADGSGAAREHPIVTLYQTTGVGLPEYLSARRAWW